MIIDFHTHCYKGELAAKAVSKIPDSRLGPFYDGSLEGLQASMPKNGIDISVALHIANRPESTPKVNDWALECAKNKGIISFGSVHPYYGDYKAEIARLKQSGIKGLKFHPYYQQYDVNDRKAYPVYEEAAAQGMIMIFHIGIDVLIPGEFGTTDKFAQMLNDIPYDKFVAAHLGGSLTVELAEKLIWGRDLYLDTSLSFRFLPPDVRKRLMDSHDKHKLIFGSDGPWGDPQEDFKIMDSFFNESDRRLIYHDNAARLLGLASY